MTHHRERAHCNSLPTTEKNLSLHSYLSLFIISPIPYPFFDALLETISHQKKKNNGKRQSVQHQERLGGGRGGVVTQSPTTILRPCPLIGRGMFINFITLLVEVTREHEDQKPEVPLPRNAARIAPG